MHFIDLEIVFQKGSLTYPRSHSFSVAESECEPRFNPNTHLLSMLSLVMALHPEDID